MEYAFGLGKRIRDDGDSSDVLDISGKLIEKAKPMTIYRSLDSRTKTVLHPDREARSSRQSNPLGKIGARPFPPSGPAESSLRAPRRLVIVKLCAASITTNVSFLFFSLLLWFSTHRIFIYITSPKLVPIVCLGSET
jgi:hypothetical protein